jgi:hypothetical protein
MSEYKTVIARKEAMTKEDINKRFAELAGICWHECEYEVVDGFTKWVCGKCNKSRNTSDPDPNDYCSDPRLVLEVMMKREDWHPFFIDMGLPVMKGHYCIPIYWMLDKTGKFALKAIEFMEKNAI